MWEDLFLFGETDREWSSSLPPLSDRRGEPPPRLFLSLSLSPPDPRGDRDGECILGDSLSISPTLSARFLFNSFTRRSHSAWASISSTPSPSFPKGLQWRSLSFSAKGEITHEFPRPVAKRTCSLLLKPTFNFEACMRARFSRLIRSASSSKTRSLLSSLFCRLISTLSFPHLYLHWHPCGLKSCLVEPSAPRAASFHCIQQEHCVRLAA
mmetsp:Transcript_18678/g.37794  ORF Transcript_18678/g.37794 Transcript_18678/m.37794 type:complete len:210 (+) Transcript_18678:486-1115(+)